MRVTQGLHRNTAGGRYAPRRHTIRIEMCFFFFFFYRLPSVRELCFIFSLYLFGISVIAQGAGVLVGFGHTMNCNFMVEFALKEK